MYTRPVFFLYYYYLFPFKNSCWYCTYYDLQVCNVLFARTCWLFAGWLFTPKTNQVCYGTLGCFSGDAPFTNANGILPRAPDVINTRFFLLTRNNSDLEELLINDKVRKCGWRSFCEQREIKFIIHGYIDSIERPWMKKMAERLLEHVSSVHRT